MGSLLLKPLNETKLYFAERKTEAQRSKTVQSTIMDNSLQASLSLPSLVEIPDLRSRS
jgi:hypothetical protein